MSASLYIKNVPIGTMFELIGTNISQVTMY